MNSTVQFARKAVSTEEGTLGIEMTEPTISAPPTARKEHKETQMHGVVLTDDYAWLRDKEHPDVTAYLEAENAYADAVTAPLAGLREELYQEMLSHIKQTDISVSYRDGNWWYYSRTEEGLQYGIFCRKRGGPAGPDADAAEEVLLDGNLLAKGHAFFAIGDTDITDDGRWLAYTTDTRGFRQYTLHIKDLATGETLPGEVERVGSVVWAADNGTLFYTVEDEEQKRQYQLWRHGAAREIHRRQAGHFRKTMSDSTSARAAHATASSLWSKGPATPPAMPGCWPPISRWAASPSSRRAKTSTNTLSIIGTGNGLYGPTIADAISGW